MSLTKREIESQRKRSLLLNTACELFRERGYKQLSMAALAAEAGISKGMIFAFFGAKKGLYTAVVDKILNDILDYTASQQQMGASGLDSLQLTFRAGFNYLAEHPGMAQFFGQEALLLVPQTLANHKRYWVDRFTQLLEQANNEGALAQDIDINATGQAIYLLHKALVDELFAELEPKQSFDAILDAALRVIIQGITH